jgi:hypothetical protein
MCKNIIFHGERNAVKQSNRQMQMQLLDFANLGDVTVKTSLAMINKDFVKFAKFG